MPALLLQSIAIILHNSSKKNFLLDNISCSENTIVRSVSVLNICAVD